ncbi:MAG: hypothetical protein A2068_14700 [Ignavibacteria bacterium GWB2_35_6b]|nr:MAG: hypothetical protein A2068_14700 [Ignavibacteria bacterium GWB2_35_6b]
MISAFAAGCMDQENYKQFKNYIRSGGELPEGELGELQNVISLVPAVLDLEQPHSELKEKVAKKLISLQDEIKKRIKDKKEKGIQEFTELTGERKTFGTREAPRSDPFATDLHEKRYSQEEVRISSGAQKELKQPRTDEPREVKKPVAQSLPFQPEKSSQRNSQLPSGTQPVNSKLLMGLWIGIGLLTVVLIVGAFYFFKTTGSLETQVETLTIQGNELRNQLTSTTKFVTDYSEFIDFFNYKDIKIVNLAGGELSPGSSGRLFISFEAHEALLKLNDLPSPSPEEAYQVWIESRGVSYSLGLFLPKPGDKYLSIKSIPSVAETDVDIVRVTNENRAGSDQPLGSTYLSGIFLGSNPQPQRRR